MIGALEFVRPGALAALALPLVLLVLSRFAARPLVRPTGALAIWRRVAEQEPVVTARRGWRPRLDVVLVCLASALAVLAVAEPRVRAADGGGDWTIVLDASPGMHLPHGAGADTRLDAGIARALAWIESERAPGDELVWRSPGRETDGGVRAAAPPPVWLDAPTTPVARPDWSAHDRPGHVWVSDRAPERAPIAATLVLTGGDAAPGWVGVRDGRALHWDGAALVDAGPAPAPRVAIAGSYPAPLETLVRLWMDERGALDAGRSEDAGLRLVGPDEPATRTRVVGRDGWSAVAGLADLDLGTGPGWTAWLSEPGAEGDALVCWRAGRIEHRLAELEAPSGDPAAFAVSLGGLLDAALLAPRGVVGLEHRRAPASAAVRPGRAPERGGSAARREPALASWLGFAAAACALGASLVRFSPRRGRGRARG